MHSILSLLLSAVLPSLRDRASIDLFVVPTATFQLLYAFIVLRHDRRKVVHFNVTAHPTAAWLGHQLAKAFP